MKLVTALALGAAFAAGSAFAQEEEAKAAETTPAAKPTAKAFHFSALPFCVKTSGSVEVMKPLSQSWEAIEEGKFYPLGTSYRTGKGGEAVISFGKECDVTMSEESAFGTRMNAAGVKSRTITLKYGTISVSLVRNLPEGAFIVAAPGFVVRDPAGDSKFTYTDKGDADEALVRCVTGTMAVDGQHFVIPQMRAADEFKIVTEHDKLITILYGLSGDYIVKLDQGVKETIEVNDEGKPIAKAEASQMDWHLSPQTKVRIDRTLPAIGKRMSVVWNCYDPAGEKKAGWGFCEGRPEINFGEVVKSDKASGDEVAKKAAEATEEAAATDDAEDEKKEDSDNNSESEEN